MIIGHVTHDEYKYPMRSNFSCQYHNECESDMQEFYDESLVRCHNKMPSSRLAWNVNEFKATKLEQIVFELSLLSRVYFLTTNFMFLSPNIYFFQVDCT